MPKCQFPVFCCFWFQKSTSANILGIARNKRPRPYFSSIVTESEGETKEGAEVAKPHPGAARGGAPPYGLGSPWPLRLQLFAYLSRRDLKLRHQLTKPTETFQSRRHREAKIWGTGVSVPARRRDGEVPPEGFSIDTTAISINAAVSHEEGVVLHRG